MVTELIDTFGRRIDYVRISVTDRCDFRCVYCMTEDMRFLPRNAVMSLEEIELLAKAFTQLGVSRIRLTGGEPLVRPDLVGRLGQIGQLPGLQELLITTNGSQLVRHSQALKQAGVTRLNISLDSLRHERFQRMTCNGSLTCVLKGIDRALEQGFVRIRLNSLIMHGKNSDEVMDILEYARGKGVDVAFIEEMPLGVLSGHDRYKSYCSSKEVMDVIQQRYQLVSSLRSTAGPCRYYKMADSDINVGFISPHSHNFCTECNRVRVTVEGRLVLCLGKEHSVDLLPIMRQQPGQIEPLKEAIIAAMMIKPKSHNFYQPNEPQIIRFMSTTGG